MITIDVERTATVAVVRCIGRLTRGQAVNRLRRALVWEKNAHMILLDLSEVEALDAGGVNALVSVRDWAVSRDITIKLVNPSTFVRETLMRFRLHHLFEISSLHDALVVLAGHKCSFLTETQSAVDCHPA